MTNVTAVLVMVTDQSPRFVESAGIDGLFFAKILEGILKEGKYKSPVLIETPALPGFCSENSIEKEILKNNLQLPVPLSRREIEVLRLVAEGMTNKEIAQALFISMCTVKFHIKSIYTKLNVNGRVQAASSGRTLGLLS